MPFSQVEGNLSYKNSFLPIVSSELHWIICGAKLFLAKISFNKHYLKLKENFYGGTSSIEKHLLPTSTTLTTTFSPPFSPSTLCSGISILPHHGLTLFRLEKMAIGPNITPFLQCQQCAIRGLRYICVKIWCMLARAEILVWLEEIGISKKSS